jgi:hypothetical protein
MFLELHVKCPVILSDIHQVPFFFIDIKKSPISNFTKLHPEGPTLVHVIRQMDGHDEGEMCFS